MSKRDPLADLSRLYPQLKINASKLSGVFPLPETDLEIKVETTKDPKTWKAFDKKSGSMLTVEDVHGAAKLELAKFICDYTEIVIPELKKDPLDNLKAGGFEIAGEAQESPVEVPAVEVPKEEEIVEPGKVDEAEIKAREEREENERKLAEAEERKIIEMERREKVKEMPEPQKINEWKQGGYVGKIHEIGFEEVGPVRPNPVERPRRTIRGLTPRLAECGKIKIGRKGEMKTSARGNQFRPPEKIDHFLITTMDKVNDDFAPDTYIMKQLGENCREIPVRLPYDDPSLNFPTSYAYYDSAACKCRGDGFIALNSEGASIECNPETCPNIKDKKCKPNGVLSLILDDAPRVGGVYKFRTTGWNSINNIFSSMEFIRGLTNGLLAGLPLMLTLTPKHTVIPGTKTSTTIYMVNLEYRGSLQDMVNAIQQTMNTRALMQYSVRDFEKLAEESLSLPEAPEECKAIVEEFYPETVRA